MNFHGIAYCPECKKTYQIEYPFVIMVATCPVCHQVITVSPRDSRNTG